MNGLYRRLSEEELLKQRKEATEKKSSPKSTRAEIKRLGVADGEAVYFYVLPPYSDRNQISRELWKSYGIEDKKYYTFWKTYEIFEPGIGEKDPVLQALRAVEKHAQGKIERFWPGRKVAVNVIYVGKKALDDTGNPVGTFVPSTEPGPFIFEFSSRSYDDLMAQAYAPSMKPIFYPEHAVMVECSRQKDGVRTLYNVQLMGNKGVQGFVPEYTNLFDKYGNDVMESILGGMVDLDKLWGMPNEETKAASHRIANSIRVRFGAPGGIIGFPGPSGTSSPFPPQDPNQLPPRSATFGPTPWDSPAPTAAAPVTPVVPTPTAVIPVATQPAPVAVPAVEAPAEIPIEVLLSVPPESQPPKLPGKVQPVCFKAFKLVQASQLGHAKWCGSCPFKLLCELSSNKK
jgi:hypothetical protein